ncbi:hypothetical protein ACP4OV_006253 [Aristida adscensionis]
MSGENIHTAQTHGDGFLVQRIIPELSKFMNPGEEKLAADDNSSSRKSNATSLQMLLAKEMAKEVESKRRPPSVIARLMGLEEDLPIEEPIIDHAKSGFNERDFGAANTSLEWQEQHQFISLMTQDIHQSHDKATEYNDVFEVCKEQSEMRYFQDQTSQKEWHSENKTGQLDIVQDKFMGSKRLSEEKLHCTEELHEGLEAPSSNKDVFLKIPDKLNSTFSRHLNDIHINRTAPQTKRITVLKPIRRVEINDVGQSGTERVNNQNGLKMRKFHQSPSSKREIPSEPSRIILLRPTPGKPDRSKAKLTPRVTSFQLISRNNFNELLDDNGKTIGSAGPGSGIMQHWQDGSCHREESLLSSSCSNGYGGDESSCCDSEVDYSSGSEMDYNEEDYGGFSGSDRGHSLIKHSWNYIRRYEGPFSGSSLSNTSQFPESSVIREAKKQLSERWQIVTGDDSNQEEVRYSRRTCTLGQMLSIKEANKEDSTSGVLPVSSIRSCGMKNAPTTQSTYATTSRKNDENGERSPRKLPRSNSAPVISSMFDSMAVNEQALNPESRKLKVVVVSNKGKTSFKERVSDFFFSRSKNPRRQKSTYHSFDSSVKKVEACVVHRKPDYNHNLDANEKAAHAMDKIDSLAFQLQIATSTSESAASGGPISSDSPSGNLDKLRVIKGAHSNRDQPSPTSVLDAPSEESSCNEPETSGRTISKNAKAVSRSSEIEGVACSLSWDDTASESQLLCTPRVPSILSDVDDEESECHVLVQNIMSSAGFSSAQSSTVFAGWHLPDHPLNPVLCNKVLELWDQTSYQKLLFDCVNVALIEIGENALLSAFPSKAHSGTRRDSSPDLGVEVWSILKDWIYGVRTCVVGKRSNTGMTLDRIVKQEIEGRGWVKLMMLQVVEITEQLEGGVMEQLMEETVLDFAAC